MSDYSANDRNEQIERSDTGEYLARGELTRSKATVISWNQFVGGGI